MCIGSISEWADRSRKMKVMTAAAMMRLRLKVSIVIEVVGINRNWR